MHSSSGDHGSGAPTRKSKRPKRPRALLSPEPSHTSKKSKGVGGELVCSREPKRIHMRWASDWQGMRYIEEGEHLDDYAFPFGGIYYTCFHEEIALVYSRVGGKNQEPVLRANVPLDKQYVFHLEARELVPTDYGQCSPVEQKQCWMDYDGDRIFIVHRMHSAQAEVPGVEAEGYFAYAYLANMFGVTRVESEANCRIVTIDDPFVPEYERVWKHKLPFWLSTPFNVFLEVFREVPAEGALLVYRQADILELPKERRARLRLERIEEQYRIQSQSSRSSGSGALSGVGTTASGALPLHSEDELKKIIAEERARAVLEVETRLLLEMRKEMMELMAQTLGKSVPELPEVAEPQVPKVSSAPDVPSAQDIPRGGPFKVKRAAAVMAAAAQASRQKALAGGTVEDPEGDQSSARSSTQSLRGSYQLRGR